MWQLGDIHGCSLDVRQPLTSEKRFLSPRRGSNPQNSDDWRDALTIELPRLKWRAKVRVPCMCDKCGSHRETFVYPRWYHHFASTCTLWITALFFISLIFLSFCIFPMEFKRNTLDVKCEKLYILLLGKRVHKRRGYVKLLKFSKSRKKKGRLTAITEEKKYYQINWS